MNGNNDINKDIKKNTFQNAAARVPIKVLDAIIIFGIAAIAVLMFK
jgi:hypothetical protein